MFAGLTFIASSAGRGAKIARRGESEWTVETVLADHDVRCIAVHPSDSAHWYAGTQGNGVFETTDSGASWTSAGLEGMIVKSVSVAPDFVYAGTKPARVYASNDGGGTWNERDSFRRIPGRRLW